MSQFFVLSDGQKSFCYMCDQKYFVLLTDEEKYLNIVANLICFYCLKN